MGKIASAFIIVMIVSISFANTVFAGSNNSIVEVPDVKIIMDGQITQYNDIPININGLILLPLRELLVNLGVPDDDAHIIWNGDEKSVTINKDDKKIYLQVGSSTALVNDETVSLDAAPVIYEKNGRTYIPLRFVSNVLGKRTVWDGSTHTVLIRDAAEYNQIKNILDKAGTALQETGRYTANMGLKAAFEQGLTNMDMNMGLSENVDIQNKTAYSHITMDMLGMNLETDSYLYGNTLYMMNATTGGWEKNTLSDEEYDAVFDEAGNSMTLSGDNDILCAGLVLSDSENPDEILLKGDIILSDLLNEALAESVTGESNELGMDKFNIEITFDSKTYLPKNILFSAEGTKTENDIKTDTNMTLNINYDYSGDFEITVPDDAVKNAVETDNLNFNLF